MKIKIRTKILKISWLIFISWWFLPISAKAGDSLRTYKLGEGIRISNINISGYLTLNNGFPRTGKNSLVVDDLSLFVQGRFNSFLNPFIEAEIIEIPLYVEGNNLFSGKKARTAIERLYNDSHLNRNLTVRLGKSLDPVGEWNSVHAGPLVPTSTRPLTSFRSFSEFISGISLIYRPDNDVLPNITAYWQPERELFKIKSRVANREFSDIKGLYLSWNWGFDNIFGLSFQEADTDKARRVIDERQYLLGVNLHLVKGAFQFQTEFTKVWLKNPLKSRARTTETGIYIQGLYNLSEQWAVFTRYEYFKDRDFLRGSNNALVGVKFSPVEPVVWKLEYVKQWGQILDIYTGIVASVSVLF